MCAVESTIYFVPNMMVKPIVRRQNGEFTSNLLEIINFHAATALLERQHRTSQVTAQESQLMQQTTRHKIYWWLHVHAM